jgi:hypothetical protein
MAAERATFEEVLALARSLSRAEQARLVARLTPAMADEPAPEPVGRNEIVKHLPEDSPAGQLVRDPISALGMLVRLIPDDRIPSEEELARWREERLVERYGA